MSEGESKKIPEWGIFDRMDEVESITLELMDKTSQVEPTLKKTHTVSNDANILARHAFIFAFGHWSANKESQYIREKIDGWLAHLKKQGMSKESLDWVKQLMVYACELEEKSIGTNN